MRRQSRGRVVRFPSFERRKRGRPDFARERERLLGEIEAQARETGKWTGQTALDSRVMAAMEAVPRHEFVPEAERHLAYANNALPVGCRQTISQPFVVALMTDLLGPRPDDVALEIGTGSGYQAAVLSLLVRRVHTVERIAELADRAGGDLRRLGYDNIEIHSGDGTGGWPASAPYDKIIVTAEAADVPPALLVQLKPGGRLVMPVGEPDGQDLTLLHKNIDGTIDRRTVLPVVFVPLRSDEPA